MLPLTFRLGMAQAQGEQCNIPELEFLIRLNSLMVSRKIRKTSDYELRSPPPVFCDALWVK